MALSKKEILRKVLYEGEKLEDLCSEQFLKDNPINITGECRVCNENVKQDSFTIVQTYWIPFVTHACHKDCVNNHKIEIYECQKIDMSCNDCIYLDRENKWCKKKDEKTTINPNMCHPQNIECFKHRNDK